MTAHCRAPYGHFTDHRGDEDDGLHRDEEHRQAVRRRLPAVNDVSLDIADGEFMILVGPSGCGKSTLLRMIVGLEDITSGDMIIGGKRSTTWRRVTATCRWCSRTTRSTRT